MSYIGYTPCKELVTALLERWRPETNTFHLIQGEATITSEGVEVLMGLPTTGLPIIAAPDRRSTRVTYASSDLASHLQPEPLVARQSKFRGLRGCSTVCQMRHHQKLLHSTHGHSHGFL
ncbi:Serine/threonine-protein phosphatase 7 long form homolog [Linum perenne]